MCYNKDTIKQQRRLIMEIKDERVYCFSDLSEGDIFKLPNFPIYYMVCADAANGFTKRVVELPYGIITNLDRFNKEDLEKVILLKATITIEK